MFAFPRSDALAPYVAVPALLALLAALQQFTHAAALAYVILPPLAVIIFLIFSEPDGPSASFVSIVVLPTLGAALGTGWDALLGFSPGGIALAVLSVLGAQRLLRAQMPPALALAVLAMMLHVEPFAYTLGVLEGTLVVAAAFAAWRALSPRGRPSSAGSAR